MLASIVILAASTMYLTSMEAWDEAGAELALQRNVDRVVEKVLSDVRSGSAVTVGKNGTSITIVRATSHGDSIVGVYAFAEGVLRNQFGVALLDNVESGKFESPDGVKIVISVTLEDDMGTSALKADDARMYITAAAVCRWGSS